MTNATMALAELAEKGERRDAPVRRASLPTKTVVAGTERSVKLSGCVLR